MQESSGVIKESPGVIKESPGVTRSEQESSGGGVVSGHDVFEEEVDRQALGARDVHGVDARVGVGDGLRSGGIEATRQATL